MKQSKSVEYWIHMKAVPFTKDEVGKEETLDILPGNMWRQAREIAANPPDDVTLVERVVRWGNDAQGVTDAEYTVLYERSDPELSFQGPSRLSRLFRIG